METIVEQSLKEEVVEFTNFLKELTDEERKEVISFFDGARFMKRLTQTTIYTNKS